jgi:outer membrane protein OmpA-like peptidoglycan-associated protein
MLTLRMLSAGIAAVVLTACAAAPPRAPVAADNASAQASNARATPAYRIDNARAVGLVQAFSLRGQTYLQTFGAPELQVRAAANASPLPLQRKGDYLIVQGVYDRLYVSDRDRSATIKKIIPSVILIQNFRAAGSIQAFHDGDYTYLQTFVDSAPQLRAEPDSAPLKYAREGEYLVLQGAYDRLYISEGENLAHAESSVPPAVAQRTPEPAPASASAPELDKVKRENTRLRDALRRAQAELDRAHEAAVPSKTATEETIQTRKEYVALQGELHQVRGELEHTREAMEQLRQSITETTYLDGADSPTTQVAVQAQPRLAQNRGRYLLHFQANSAELATDQQLLDTVLPLIGETQMVILRGRTALGEAAALAQARAIAVRDLLVAKGVDVRNLRVLSYSPGLYIADNATDAGRARNRRVEIELAPPPNRPRQQESKDRSMLHTRFDQ